MLISGNHGHGQNFEVYILHLRGVNYDAVLCRSFAGRPDNPTGLMGESVDGTGGMECFDGSP